jgi:hypothetical protein
MNKGDIKANSSAYNIFLGCVIRAIMLCPLSLRIKRLGRIAHNQKLNA